MRGINAGINHSDCDGALIGFLLIELPGFFYVDINSSYSVCLNGVIVTGAKRRQGDAVDSVFAIVYIDAV